MLNINAHNYQACTGIESPLLSLAERAKAECAKDSAMEAFSKPKQRELRRQGIYLYYHWPENSE